MEYTKLKLTAAIHLSPHYSTTYIVYIHSPTVHCSNKLMVALFHYRNLSLSVYMPHLVPHSNVDVDQLVQRV